MPEGHTIHRLARGLATTLRDEPLEATSPQGRFTAGAALLDGERVVRSEAWGKYLFVETTAAHILHVHLGLIGKFRSKPLPPPSPTDTVRLRLSNMGGCWDLTGPTRCELISPDERHSIVSSLGPDPLRPRQNVDRARAKMAASTRTVGAILLDQSVIAGLGNVYRAEILFLCGIHPGRESRRLSDADFEAIWSESVRLLRIGRRTGRIITTSPEEVGRSRGRMRPEDALYVYHREYCRRCASSIHTLRLGGRPMQFCSTCQPS